MVALEACLRKKHSSPAMPQQLHKWFQPPNTLHKQHPRRILEPSRLSLAILGTKPWGEFLLFHTQETLCLGR